MDTQHIIMTTNLSTIILVMTWVDIIIGIIKFFAILTSSIIGFVLVKATNDVVSVSAPDFKTANQHIFTAVSGLVVAVFVVLLLLALSSIVSSFILRKSVNKRDHRGCKIWLIKSIVWVAISLLTIAGGEEWWKEAPQAIWKIGLCIFVYKFMEELRQDNTEQHKPVP